MGLKDLIKKITRKGTAHSINDPIGAIAKPIDKPVDKPDPTIPVHPIPVPKPIKPKEEDM